MVKMAGRGSMFQKDSEKCEKYNQQENRETVDGRVSGHRRWDMRCTLHARDHITHFSGGYTRWNSQQRAPGSFREYFPAWAGRHGNE